MCGLWRRLQTRPSRSACEGFVVRVGPGGRPNPRIPSFRQSFRSAYGSHGSIYVQCRRDRGRRRRIRACRLRIASCSIIMLSYRRTHLLRDRAGMDWMTETAMKCNVWGAGGCGAWFCRRWGCDLFFHVRCGPDRPKILIQIRDDFTIGQKTYMLQCLIHEIRNRCDARSTLRRRRQRQRRQRQRPTRTPPRPSRRR